MGGIRTQFGDKLTKIEDRWSGNRMDFNVAALGQSISGHLEVFEDNVRVDLPAPRPVLIVYATAEATEKGEARFYPDVYRLDRELNELLSRGYPYPRGALKPRDKVAQGRISTEVPSGMTR